MAHRVFGKIRERGAISSHTMGLLEQNLLGTITQLPNYNFKKLSSSPWCSVWVIRMFIVIALKSLSLLSPAFWKVTHCETCSSCWPLLGGRLNLVQVIGRFWAIDLPPSCHNSWEVEFCYLPWEDRIHSVGITYLMEVYIIYIHCRSRKSSLRR